MKKNEMLYRKDVAFINREKELAFLKGCLNERPESIIFIHGPKSSGKTTLLYKFLDQRLTIEEQALIILPPGYGFPGFLSRGRNENTKNDPIWPNP